MPAQVDIDYVKTRPGKILPRILSYTFFEGRPVTTKGQWINPLIFGQFELIKKLPQLKKVQQPVFIVGTGRSGTTILGVLLSMHRDVGFLNEPKALWHAIHPGEDVIGSYSDTEGFFRLGEGDVTAEVVETAHRIYGAYLTAVGSRRVLDKYPELVFRVPFVKQIFPDAKFIFLVRNGWDTCYSIKRWSERLGTEKSGEVHDWWGVNNRKWCLLIDQIVAGEKRWGAIVDIIKGLQNHIDMAMVEWIVTMEEGLTQMRLNPECFLKVKFEDLTTHPKKELQRILGFCGLSHDSAVFNYAKKVVSPVRPHPQMGIHPCLTKLVEDTSRALGY